MSRPGTSPQEPSDGRTDGPTHGRTDGPAGGPAGHPTGDGAPRDTGGAAPASAGDVGPARAARDPATVDALPPEARFAIRALAAGATPDAIDRALRTTGDAARNPLRTAARWLGAGPPPARTAGDEALLAALARPLAAAGAAPPGRRPGTTCPAADVLSELAAGRLGGPILLATAEHAADCPACLALVVAASRAGDPEPPPARGSTGAPVRGPRRLGLGLALVLGALAGLAAAAWYLLRS